MRPAVTPPDFIPEDIQAAHLDEARWLVQQRAPQPSAPPPSAPQPSAPSDGSAPRRTGAPPRRRVRSRLLGATRAQRRNVAAAGLMALPGTLLLTGLWGWLALTTGEAVWWAIAGGGAAMTAVLAVAIASFALARSLRADPACEPAPTVSHAEISNLHPSADVSAPNPR